MPSSPNNSRRSRARNQLLSKARGGSRRNRRNRAGLWDAIKTANERAHARADQRNFRRRGVRSVKAAIASELIDDYRLPTAQLILRTTIGLILLFPCFISTLAIFHLDDTHTGDVSFWQQLLHSRPFLYFAVGTFLMLGWFYIGLLNRLFLYLYVLGHELTHAIFIYLCGGKVSEFKVTADGGHVVTNKTNILIALSPYFVPFWSAIILSISLLLECFWDIPYHSEALYLMIGASWTFHLCWTLWMIPRDQPDLKENGSFFSLTIIYLANIILLASMLCLAPNGFSFKLYCYQWINLAIENGRALKDWVWAMF